MYSKTKKALESAIKQTMSQHPNSVMAEILDYHYYSNRATVRFQLAGYPNWLEISNVPFRVSCGGVIENQPRAGDWCLIEFERGDVMEPCIVAFHTPDHPTYIRRRQDRTHAGAEIPIQTSDWTDIPVGERPIQDLPPQLGAW